MRARVPASSANLGPGFDTLAVALDRYVEVDVEPASKLIVRTEGEGQGLADDSSHLAARVAIDVAGHDRLAITVRSQIPIARGLGSSAALAVAAAAAAGAEDPLAVAAAIDGHADNAAASAVGGLVAAARVRGGVHVVRLPLDVSLAFVVMVPDVTLSTARARQALPAEVTRENAVFNLSRMALLLAWPTAASSYRRRPRTGCTRITGAPSSRRPRRCWRPWWPAARWPRAGRGPDPP